MPISSSGLCAASASATDCCSNCNISSCGIKLVKSTKSGPSFPAFLRLYLRIGKKKSRETTMSPMSVWFNATSLGELGEEIHGPTLRSKSSNCKASAKAVASVRGHRRREWWVTRYCIVPTLGNVQYTPREPTISLRLTKLVGTRNYFTMPVYPKDWQQHRTTKIIHTWRFSPRI